MFVDTQKGGGMRKPIIGITMGDAAGIGPEVIVKALKTPSIYEECLPVVIGDGKILEDVILKIKNEKLQISSIKNIEEAKFEFGTVDCLDLNNISLDELEIGKINEITGKASIEYIKKIVKLAQDSKIQAITTAPICKEAINKAGFNFPGHTELLAHLTHTRKYAMMFVSDVLKVILVTIHIPLHKVIHNHFRLIIKNSDNILYPMLF